MKDKQLGAWMAAGAKKMGYTFDVDELDAALKAELKSLGRVRRIAFLGGVLNAGLKTQQINRMSGR